MRKNKILERRGKEPLTILVGRRKDRRYEAGEFRRFLADMSLEKFYDMTDVFMDEDTGYEEYSAMIRSDKTAAIAAVPAFFYVFCEVLDKEETSQVFSDVLCTLAFYYRGDYAVTKSIYKTTKRIPARYRDLIREFYPR